jgi:Helix-turn-helix.
MEDQGFDAHYLADWRKFAGLTQEEVGRALGLTGAQVSRVETGTRLWDRKYLQHFKDLVNDTLERHTASKVRIRHVSELLSCKPEPYSLVMQSTFLQHQWNKVLADMAEILLSEKERQTFPLKAGSRADE